MKKPKILERDIQKSVYTAQIKNLEKAWEANKVAKIEIACHYCAKKMYKTLAHISKRKNCYCSKECKRQGVGETISKTNRGRVISEGAKEKLRAYKGSKASNWKGGKPKCKECEKEINYRSTYCLNHKHLLWTQTKWEKAWDGSRKKLSGVMPKNLSSPGKFHNIQRGYFDINGESIFFRSKWEANYALFLDFLIKQGDIVKWEYEVDVFMFDKIKSGTRSYRPDFKIHNNDDSIEYHEVKGWMTPKSKTQLKRMAKYHPDTILVLIESKQYNELKNKLGKLLGFY